MGDREVFTRPFAAALQQACTGRRLTQKRIGELIAQHQHEHRRRGPEREAVIAAAKTQWPGRLSAWKKGDRLPATLEELFLALDVIASDIPRTLWEQWWRQARDPVPAEPGPMAVSLPPRPLDLSLVPAWPSDDFENTQEPGQENPSPGTPNVGSTFEPGEGRPGPRLTRLARVILAIACALSVITAVVIFRVFDGQSSLVTPPTANSPDNSAVSISPMPYPGTVPCQASMNGLELTFPSCPTGTLKDGYTPKGRVSDLHNGESVWLLLWATGLKKFYLVSGDPAATSDGEWQQSIGVDASEHGLYYLYAVIVDAKSRMLFASTYKHNYPSDRTLEWLDIRSLTHAYVSVPSTCCTAG
jgi:hypothetical protein